MKKASVITMHRIYNYGSVLQSYATKRILEEAGLQCEILDYISPYRAKKPLFLEYPPRLEGKKVKKILYYAAKIPSFAIKDITFGGFIKKYLKLSPKQYITNEDILKNPPKADIYISGSDQVWNSKYNHGVDPSYYLNYAQPGSKKMAFVSSFGRSELSKEESDIVEPMLKEYDNISVREDSAADILAGMGIGSEVLIDPTLQVRKEDWLSLASPLLVKQRYLLLFLLYNEDNGATEYAQRVAKEKGLKVVKLSWELKKPAGVDYLFTHRKPQDFLSLFANGSCVCIAKGKPRLSAIAQVAQILVLFPVVYISSGFGFKALYTARTLIRFEGIFVFVLIMKISPGISILEMVKGLLVPAFCSGIMALIALTLQSISHSVIWSFVSIGICALVYFMVMLLFPKERKELLHFFTKIVRKIKK